MEQKFEGVSPGDPCIKRARKIKVSKKKKKKEGSGKGKRRRGRKREKGGGQGYKIAQNGKLQSGMACRRRAEECIKKKAKNPYRKHGVKIQI